MARKSVTVRGLAREAGVDLDEVLVILWDLGIDNVMNPADLVAPRDIDRARQALGVATRRELRSPAYWCTVLGISEHSLRQLLSDVGVNMGARATKLPPKAVSRLKARARALGIDPLTGVISAREAQESKQTARRSTAEPVPRFSVDEPFKWRPPGHRRPLRWLSEAQVESIHFALVNDLASSEDPISPPGIQSENLLASAAFRPQTAIRGELKYPTVEASAAALLHALVLDHAFFNGNKRTALVSMLVFLDQNGLVPTCDEDALFKLVLQVAQHRITAPAPDAMADREVQAIAAWLCECTRVVEKGERPVPWRRLRQILVSYGCELDFPAGTGNRVNIIRRLKQKASVFGKKPPLARTTQVFYRDEGSDVDVGVIKKIREDLLLDDLHGVDSYDFYAKEPTRISDFIAKYRKTLCRLARL